MQLILRKKVESAIKSLFYKLDDIQRAKLEAEFSLVEKYGTTGLFYTMSTIYDELDAHNVECKLYNDSGYSFSYILFILGVSTLNPFNFTQIDTLARIEKELNSHSPIILLTDKGTFFLKLRLFPWCSISTKAQNPNFQETPLPLDPLADKKQARTLNHVPIKSKRPALVRCSNGKRGGFCCCKGTNNH